MPDSLDDFEPWPTPTDPAQYTCGVCKERPADGSVGDMFDRSFTMWVCQDCYHNKLEMRPLGSSIDLTDHTPSCSSCLKARAALREWVTKSGHDRCWYYPDIFRQLCSILGVDTHGVPDRVSREEFQHGCERYQQEEYGG